MVSPWEETISLRVKLFVAGGLIVEVMSESFTFGAMFCVDRVVVRAQMGTSWSGTLWGPQTPSVLSQFSRVLTYAPMDCSLSGSPVHKILEARILGVIATLLQGNLTHPGMEPASLVSPVWAGGFFLAPPPGKPQTPRV